MATRTEAGREFWRSVLAAGGVTAIPRWTLDPAPGVAEHDATSPTTLVAALRRLADELALPLELGAAGRARQGAGRAVRRARGRDRLRGRAGRPAAALPADHRARLVAVAAAGRPPGRGGPAGAHRTSRSTSSGASWAWPGRRSRPCSTRAGDRRRPRRATPCCRVGVSASTAGRLVLRLRYRTDVLDADSAARIAGYHLTALALMAADPDAEHGRQSLLSAEELRFQLDGLAGPRRELPDRRFHELFEQRVRTHPDAVAAVHGDRQWTYRELNARANRLGRALLARGLRREGVVAVVTERNLDWMAAVIAIFKAGGVYLPIEPHFPADRIATTLSRAECTLVLTEPGSTTTLDQALDTLPGVQTAPRRRGLRGGPRRRRPRRRRRGRPARLHLLHLRLHRRAQGRDVRARRHAQPPLRQDRRPGDRRGRRWSPRPRRSASTSRCGSWSPRCWSAGGPCWSSRR